MKRIFARTLITLIIAGGALSIGGCNTVSGIGEDLMGASESVKKSMSQDEK